MASRAASARARVASALAASASRKRAVFLIDPDNRVRYVEYVRELTEHPNYYTALEAVRNLSEG